MKTWRLQLALLFGLAIICGCKPSGDTSARKAEEVPPPSNSTGPKQFTEEDLAKTIIVGMHKDALVRPLGQPAHTMDLEDGRVRLDYVFNVPNKPGPVRVAVAGVTVYLKDNKVVQWSPAYGSTGGYREGDRQEVVQSLRDANKQIYATNDLSFWIASQEPVDGGRYIDTVPFPKLGFVRKEPNLNVNRLKSLIQDRVLVLNDKGEEIERGFLNVHLVDEDAPALEKITQENQGKTLLIMVGDKPVAAPKILGVIPKGMFQLHCKDDNTLKEAREKLAKLLSR